MKILKLLLIPLILFSTAVQAQDISYMGIIGKGQALGAKDSNDTVVPVLGIDSSNNTFLRARSGKSLAFGNTAITGTLSVSGVTTLSSDIKYNDSSFYIYSASSDGADNQDLILAGGGSNTEARGAHMLLAGNESASTGALSFSGGNISSSNISFSINHASALIRFFNASGGRIAYFNNSGGLFFDATNGGNIVMTKANTSVAQPITNTISAAGTTTANATALTGVINYVTTVASGTGVRLWEAEVGSVIIVHNLGANALLVYPPASGQIYGYAVDAGASVASASVVYCTKRAASGGNSWVCNESPSA